MSAPTKMFLIRRSADGTMRTVLGTSHRVVVQKFVLDYRGLEPGEDLMVKERLATEDWQIFRFLGNGAIRKVAG